MIKQAVLIAILLCAGVAYAAPTPDDLKRIEKQLQEERRTGLEARKKASELSQEMKAVQRQIIGSAKNVQEKEETLSTLEEKLADLNKRQNELEQKISVNEAQLAEIMKGLQNLALRPKEILFLKPMAPIDTVRSHMLMQNSIPILGIMNENARRDLADLLETRSKITSQAKRIKTAAEELAEKKARMEKLLQQKKALQARYQATHQQATKRASALASQAKDLKDLLRKLALEKQRQAAERARKEKARQAEMARRKQLAASGQPAPAGQKPLPEYTPPRGVAKGAFAKSYGSLLYPVRGRVTRNFGDTTVSGAHIKGMSITTRPNAQVIAPFDGTVLFAGPFKNYGQLVIIDNGDNYLTLLAGLNRIAVNVGQELLAGEPIGTTPDKNPSLYIEIRKNGIAINPKPWFPRI